MRTRSLFLQKQPYTKIPIIEFTNYLKKQILSFDPQLEDFLEQTKHYSCVTTYRLCKILHQLLVKAAPVDSPHQKRHRNGDYFEGFILDLFLMANEIDEGTLMGAHVSGTRGDGGIDIEGVKGNNKIIIECKNWCYDVSKRVIKKMHEIEGDYVKYVVAFGSFGEEARAYAYKHNIQLYDKEDILEMLHDNISVVHKIA
uniref:Restriction endonuclease type IV Mrr domain-containing protein n=1 Tax=Megaviridae environmental sample TaxID=1737588 RepID=A0A5J6VI64_9VIRU|nr:MAG: hypothetical protein [Megaviridae environmental sample]